MSDKFDWSNTNPDIVVKRQEAVAVYLNPDGDIVVRREASWPSEDEDTFIVVPRGSARRFIEMVERLLLPEPKAD